MATLVSSAPSPDVSPHLCFHVADTAFGVPIRRVMEVIPYAREVRVDAGPRTIRGVMDVVGEPLPLVDLRLKFRGVELVPSAGTAVLVVECRVPGGTLRFGLVVDRVGEIVQLTVADVDPPPATGTPTDWLEGLGRLAGETLVLLDLDRLLTEHERWCITLLSLHPQSH